MIQAVKCFLTKPIGLDLGIDPQRRKERRGAWQLIWPFMEAAEFGAGWGVRDLVSPTLSRVGHRGQSSGLSGGVQLAWGGMGAWPQVLRPRASPLPTKSSFLVFVGTGMRAVVAACWCSKGSSQKGAAGFGNVLWASTSAPGLIHLYP